MSGDTETDTTIRIGKKHIRRKYATDFTVNGKDNLLKESKMSSLSVNKIWKTLSWVMLIDVVKLGMVVQAYNPSTQEVKA